MGLFGKLAGLMGGGDESAPQGVAPAALAAVPPLHVTADLAILSAESGFRAWRGRDLLALPSLAPLMDEARNAVGGSGEEFDRLIVPSVVQAAEFMQFLPAAEERTGGKPHHTEHLGLLIHSIETMIAALNIGRQHFYTHFVDAASVTPDRRNEFDTAARVAVALLALLHDIGKVDDWEICTRVGNEEITYVGSESVAHFLARSHHMRVQDVYFDPTGAIPAERVPRYWVKGAYPDRGGMHEAYAPAMLCDFTLREARIFISKVCGRKFYLDFQTALLPSPDQRNALATTIKEADKESAEQWTRTHRDSRLEPQAGAGQEPPAAPPPDLGDSDFDIDTLVPDGLGGEGMEDIPADALSELMGEGGPADGNPPDASDASAPDQGTGVPQPREPQGDGGNGDDDFSGYGEDGEDDGVPYAEAILPPQEGGAGEGPESIPSPAPATGAPAGDAPGTPDAGTAPVPVATPDPPPAPTPAPSQDDSLLLSPSAGIFSSTPEPVPPPADSGKRQGQVADASAQQDDGLAPAGRLFTPDSIKVRNESRYEHKSKERLRELAPQANKGICTKERYDKLRALPEEQRKKELDRRMALLAAMIPEGLLNGKKPFVECLQREIGISLSGKSSAIFLVTTDSALTWAAFQWNPDFPRDANAKSFLGCLKKSGLIIQTKGAGSAKRLQSEIHYLGCMMLHSLVAEILILGRQKPCRITISDRPMTDGMKPTSQELIEYAKHQIARLAPGESLMGFEAHGAPTSRKGRRIPFAVLRAIADNFGVKGASGLQRLLNPEHQEIPPFAWRDGDYLVVSFLAPENPPEDGAQAASPSGAMGYTAKSPRDEKDRGRTETTMNTLPFSFGQ